VALQGQPTVTEGLKQAPGGLIAVLNALRAFDNPDAQAFVALHDSITPTDRKFLSLEEIAVAADVGSSRLLGVAVEALRAYGQSISQVILWAGMPKIVKRAVRNAAQEKYAADREMVFKAAAFVPVPKGSNVAVQVNNQLPAPKEEIVRPWDPAAQLQGIQEAWGGRKSLPAPTVEHEALTPTLESLQDRTAGILDAD
jgi:hypothetical protein